MIVFWNNIIFSLRMLAVRPLITGLGVLTMGIGIGISTSQIIIYQGLLAPTLPFDEPEQIVSVKLKNEKRSFDIHRNLFEYWRNNQKSFESLLSFTEGTINVYHHGRAVRYSGSWVNPSFNQTLRIDPFMGEGFGFDDETARREPAVLLGYDIWQSDFASDPAIIGESILVNSVSTMVIGIMPKGFNFPFNSDLWIPEKRYPETQAMFLSNPSVTVAGRLNKGIRLSDAVEELNVLKQDYFKLLPENYRYIATEEASVVVQPFVESTIDNGTKGIMILSIIVVSLVLLIACANVTNLMLSGFSTRIKELAVRCALGATKREIALQMLTESCMIAFGGACLGLIYSLWAIDWANEQFSSMDVPFWFHLSLSKEVLLSTFLVASFAGLIAGILPILKVLKLSLNEILQDDSRTASSMSVSATNRTLVVMQISVSCALLIVTGMIISEYSKVRHADFPFEADSVIAARLGLFEEKYQSNQSKHDFVDELLELLRSQQQVKDASITTRLQYLNFSNMNYYQIETDQPGVFHLDRYIAYSDSVSENYFSALGLSILQGVDFSEKLSPDSDINPVIVTPKFVHKHYPDGNVIGKNIRHIIEKQPYPSVRIYEIVGVGPETLVGHEWEVLNDSVGVYLPFRRQPTRFLTITIRPNAGYNPYELIPLMKRCVSQIDEEIPLYFIETPKDSYEANYHGFQLSIDLFLLFSAVALLLSLVGTFGITSFSVLEKIQEIGIRKSLGATGEEIFLLIMKQGLIQLALGISLGVCGGLSLSYALKMIFPHMSIVDPFVYLAVIVVLVISTLAAIFYPARMASRISPAEATRVN